ncbi:MAG: hypothetical protein AAF943_01050 [Pseudomonadota bacterium]
MTKKRTKFRAKGRGVVLTIAALLVSSALLRLGGDTGQAIAQALTQPMKPTAPAMSEDHLDKAVVENASKTGADRTEMSNLLASLREREMRVKKLESQIEMRRKALEVADAEVRKRLAILEQTEANLRETLALADGAAEDDLARLTAVYEQMKPKEAADLFATMEPDFAAGFLGRMRPDAAASIMAGLPPEIAYSISVILAGRNANVPKT